MQNHGTFVWQWDFIKNIIELTKTKQFAKTLKKSTLVYAIFAQFETTLIRVKIVKTTLNERNNFEFEISVKFKDFENVFSKKQTNIFASYQINNYIIEIENKELSYSFLYNLSMKKLKTLREYINFALKKK